MFDSVRNNKRVVQIILLLLILPFAFFGVESYMQSMGRSTDLARVGDTTIGPQEFSNALREQQDVIRARLGKDYDPAMFDKPEIRRAVLDQLIARRLQQLQAKRDHLSVSDAQVGQFVRSMPQLQQDGQFSMERYEQLLQARGMSSVGFEQRLRGDLVLSQQIAAVANSGFIPQPLVVRWAELQGELREVSETLLDPQSYTAKVNLAQDAAKKFYDDNRKMFATPEQVKVEYLLLSPEALLGSVQVTDAQAQDFYKQNQGRYATPELRSASHILIALSKGAAPDARKAAKEKAESLLKQVRADPKRFAKLARENSDDPGSKQSGGDLGSFESGAMVKPFADAVFGLAKVGDIADLVESDFGFHVIMLTGITPSKDKKFEEARAEIVEQLKQAAAAKRFAELAESFKNTVYEQADSLAPAEQLTKLKLQKSDWMEKGKPAPGVLGNDKLLAAVFSDDTIKNKRNTEAIEVAPKTLVAARVIEHKAAAEIPFDQVSARIEQQLKLEEARKLARQDGEAKLAELQKGDKVDLKWGAPNKVSRAAAQGPVADLVTAVFRAPADKLPTYVGGALPNGAYGIYKVLNVARDPEASSAAGLGAARAKLERASAEDEFLRYLAVLRQRFGVKVNQAALDALAEK
ncbi:MAG: SurA N-terminal domain-containing protein [Rhodocyclaceae bacterium]|nr:SurA N-terminal domain-containing protein [Rhodocyclaceae bacterium]MBX3670884.1 SurA N-terminal domain-containing protein [Rhodocyclaceae bacterium]